MRLGSGETGTSRSTRARARVGRALAAVVGVLALAATAQATAVAVPDSAPGHNGRPDALTITSVSNPHPEYVSGGDVLLRVDGTDGPSVELNGRDVTRAFQRQADGSWLGLVSGLREGRNTVVAQASRWGWSRDKASLRLDNHPITGPVFSGPQQTPFFCETTAFGLPAATQPLCTAPTQVTYQYKTTAGAFAPLADPASRPADLATATVGGRAVPYIVRVERGTIDRAVYEVAALYDGTNPTPYRQDTSWNQRLVYTFGGGCNAGFHQGAGTGGVVNDLFLSQGYAVASSSLNVLDNNCSTIISAEAAMMVKEHVVETYGPVAHTIGWGGSGGAIQQYNISDQYPGILDGIVPGVSFPDVLTTLQPVADCALLGRYYAAGGASLTPAQRKAIEGFQTTSTCGSWIATFANRVTATGSCNPAVPVAVRWDPATNPTGVKCDVFEQLITQLGRDPKTGYARRTWDNVGLQYGLNALLSKAITPQQFVDLNAAVGGFDANGVPTTTRTVADRRALDAAYRADLMNSAAQGLRQTAIIDQRTDLDFAGFGNDIHTTEWSYVMRARLMRAQGNADNQVIIENQPTADQIVASNVYELSAMDRWLTAVDADRSGASLSAKIVRNRPADLSDGCYLTAAQRIQEPLTVPASGRCGALYPVATNTRIAAGDPFTMTAMKCATRPVRASSYPGITFTAEQLASLRATFPTGVCDYARRGVQERPTAGTWLSYGDR